MNINTDDTYERMKKTVWNNKKKTFETYMVDKFGEQEKYQNTLKGELEELIGTVECHSPMDLLDHNKVKLSLTKKN